MQLRPGNFSLARGLSVETEQLAKFVLGGGPRTVDFVAQDEDGAVGELFVRQERVQLDFGLAEAAAVARVDQEYDGVHGGEIIFPNLKRKRV